MCVYHSTDDLQRGSCVYIMVIPTFRRDGITGFHQTLFILCTRMFVYGLVDPKRISMQFF